VNIRHSSMSCNRGFRGQTGNVEITTTEGYKFSGVVKPPRKIMSMTGGDIFGGFMANVNLETDPIVESGCGGYGAEVFGNESTRGYTTTDTALWPGGVVEFSFVSDGTDDLRDSAFMVDEKIGFNRAELSSILKSMKKIEEKTCIRFHLINPEPGKDWLLLMRNGRKSQVNGNWQSICYADYINQNLRNQNFGDLGKVFDMPWNTGNCFGGAFTWGLGMGLRKVAYLVASVTSIDNSDGTIGLFQHELLHNLGVGHTQKRHDRDQYITVNWENIQESGKRQYAACEGAECETHGTPYDCSSIMHYTDRGFHNGKGPTMTPKDPSSCYLGGYGTKLTESDISLLKKMYCDQTGNNLVMSPDWGINNYPHNSVEDYHLRVEEGNVIEILFTDFDLEARSRSGSCYDWVRIEDADGTELMAKTCAGEKPVAAIRSRTNVAKIEFRSDRSVATMGFRAEWRKVSVDPPVNGEWNNWASWGGCGNNQDGKSSCTRTRTRFCNNPVPSNGGADCVGSAQESEECSPDWLVTQDGDDHPQCVVHGGWTVWSPGSECNTQCETTKTRTCTNPVPINSKACEGEASSTTSCTGGGCNSGESGEVTSPGYPNNYGNDILEETTIEVSENSKVELTFVDFEVENHDNCGYDSVEVLDSDGSQLMKICGDSLPDQVISSGNRLKVIFKTDGSVTKKGFRATWTKISQSLGGNIKSPNFPGLYPNDVNDWVEDLQVSRGYKVKLTFEAFDIEYESNCGYDYVLVSYGTFSEKYCGSTAPAPIISSGRSMRVQFITDGSVQNTGFSAVWSAVPA